MAESGFPALTLEPEVLEIVTTLEGAGYETWAVGGAIRDRILKDALSDVDLATAAEPPQVLKLFKRTVAVGVEHGTVGVLDRQGRLHEVTTFRADVETDGRHAVVRFGVSLEEDLARRDFTINAIAYHPVRREWCDPFDGRGDIARRVVRAVGVAADRFREDYLRILRALRFAARFGFTIEPETWTAAQQLAPGLAGISAERVRDEWNKGLRTARKVDVLVQLWQQSGAAAVWLPELAAAEPVPEGSHPRDPVVLTSLLTGQAAAVLRRLKASNEEIARGAALDRLPEAPADNQPLAVRRWLREVGSAADDLLLRATWRTGVAPGWTTVLAGVRSRAEPTDRKSLALSGHALQQLGVPHGPQIGVILDRLLDAVIEQPELNTEAALSALVIGWR